MERTEEFRKVVVLYDPSYKLELHSTVFNGSNNTRGQIQAANAFCESVQKLVGLLEGNEKLVSRMEKLSTQREFSNDPTAAMQEISSLFEMKLALIQKDLGFLKNEIEKGTGKLLQQGKHRDQIVKALSKTVSGHVNSFKKALQIHIENSEQRQKRVTKYGEGVDQLKSVGVAGSLSNLDNHSSNYAMFATQTNAGMNIPESGIQLEKHTSLRNRKPAAPSGSSTLDGRISGSRREDSTEDSDTKKLHPPPRGAGSYFSNYGRKYPSTAAHTTYSQPAHPSQQGQQQQQLESRANKVSDDFRLRQAEKVEASIMQMGQLFSQMASLISEQSDTLARIEDDVEAGLADTAQASESMDRFYEITKGNRGTILKVFALLVFFIFLFLVWT